MTRQRRVRDTLATRPRTCRRFLDAADRGAGASSLSVVGGFAVQGPTQVAIAESLRDVIPGQHGGKPACRVCAGRVEARVTASLVTLSLRQALEIVVARRRIVDRRQRRQLTLVAGQGVALIVMQIANSLAQREPTQRCGPVPMPTFP